jgi:hypothetical protein
LRSTTCMYPAAEKTTWWPMWLECSDVLRAEFSVAKLLHVLWISPEL